MKQEAYIFIANIKIPLLRYSTNYGKITDDYHNVVIWDLKYEDFIETPAFICHHQLLNLEHADYLAQIITYGELEMEIKNIDVYYL